MTYLTRTWEFCSVATVLLLGSQQFAVAQMRLDATTQPCRESVVAQVRAHFQLDAFAFPKNGNYPSTENGGLLAAGVCRYWPLDHSRELAAFAYDTGEQFDKQLLVALVDLEKGQILAAYKDTIPGDPGSEVTKYSLVLDTAQYALSKTVRAFALRSSTFRDRCSYDGGFSDDLRLFVIDGTRIRSVLDLSMHYWRYGPGNRCGGEEAPRLDATLSISIEPTSTNGFADLRLTARRSDKKQPLSVKVRYRGSHYDVTPWNNSFYRWWEQ